MPCLYPAIALVRHLLNACSYINSLFIYKPCLKYYPQSALSQILQVTEKSSMRFMWIYIWAVNESLSKYGTCTYFPGCHTELGNSLWADTPLKYCSLGLENTPHRLDRKKCRKVSSAATWVCFIKLKQVTVMWVYHSLQAWELSAHKSHAVQPCDRAAQLSKHMAP